jgi:hypothetical protein
MAAACNKGRKGNLLLRLEKEQVFSAGGPAYAEMRSQPGLAPLCLNAEEDDDDSDSDGDDDEEEDGVEVTPMTALISGSNGLDPEYMPVYRADC